MSTHKNIDKICVVVLVISLILTLLFMNGEALGIQTIVDEDAESYTGTEYFTERDLNGSWDTSNATVITLKGTEAKVSGAGAYAYDGDVVISSGGYYVVSGELTDGKIIVDAYSSSKVWIMLSGVNITCSDDACIRVDEADKVFLTLASGTENVLSSGETYSEEALADGTDGTIFAHDDLTINGSGSLTVYAAYKHGIAANDDLVITGGTITVSAVKDAIHANDSFRLTGADITVTADDDGIVVAHEKGYFYMESGSVNVKSSDDGIHTASDITIVGGDLTIAAGDDGIHSDTRIDISAGKFLISECYEGIEAIRIDISGGEFEIYPSDDGINANGGSSQMGGMNGGFGEGGMDGGRHQWTESQEGSGEGSQTQSAEAEIGADSPEQKNDTGDGTGEGGAGKDSGSGADYEGSTDSETRTDNRGSAGSETGTVNGDGTDNASAADGADAEKTESTGEDAGDELEPCLRISGGTLTIINNSGRDADGIDSNGDIYISGGTIYISVVNSGTNSAVDYGSESGGVCEISGGTIIACGSYSMAESFDSTSTQCSVLYTISDGVEAGTTLSLEDADGNELLDYTVPCSFSSALISCPQMQLGETYRIIAGDHTEEITLEEVSASLGDAQGGMFGGNMQGQQNGDGGLGHRGGGRNGFGRGQSVSGNRPEFSDMQQSDGQMPEFGDMQQSDGQMPEFGDMQQSDGQMPEFGGSETMSGNMPDFHGQMPGYGDGQSVSGNMSGGQEDAFSQRKEGESEETEGSEAEDEDSAVNENTWILLGASAALLLAGLLFAIRFRQK